MSDPVFSFRCLERELDPSVVGLVIEEVRLAHARYPLARISVDRFSELPLTVSGYVQHMYIHVYRQADYPINEAYDRAVELMRRANLDFEGVYDDCRRGIDGGVSTVLRKICDVIEQERIQHYTESVYRKYIEDPTDTYFIEDLMLEFSRTYAQFLPFALQHSTALVMHHKQILFQFPTLISRMRGMVGKY